MSADWAMVIITAIYVVATICIMRANQKSAKAAKEQLSEMKREHEESARLQVMPYLRFRVDRKLPVENKMMPAFIVHVNEYDNDESVGIITVVEVTNIGQGLATNIVCSWNDMENTEPFPVDYLRSEEHKSAHFMFLAKRGSSVGVSELYPLTFHFTDVLGNEYRQDIILNVFAEENNLEVTAHKAEAPVLDNEPQKNSRK